MMADEISRPTAGQRIANIFILRFPVSNFLFPPFSSSPSSPVTMYHLPSVVFLRHRRRPHQLFLPKLFSSTPQPLELPLSHPIYLIWGSNTAVGKTLVSAGIASSSLLSSPTIFHYLKPVQTGFPADSDSRFVFNKVCEMFLRRNPSISLCASNHILNASAAAANAAFQPRESQNCKVEMRELGWFEEKKLDGEGNGHSELICKTMYAWREAVSPHLAAERESGAIKDSLVVETLQRCFQNFVEDGAGKERSDVMCVVETAGGVASPGPSGSLQCDLYRPFRIPAILVGDGRLGGVSGTISAYESLTFRGYDIVAVILDDQGLLNDVPLISYLRNKVPVLVLPPVPEDPSDDLMEWFQDSHDIFANLKEIMISAYLERIRRLHDMPRKAGEIFWWPFTQHKLVSEGGVTVIDSRCGENFAVFKAQKTEVIAPVFDACASWWTQGPDATLQVISD